MLFMKIFFEPSSPATTDINVIVVLEFMKRFPIFLSNKVSEFREMTYQSVGP